MIQNQYVYIYSICVNYNNKGYSTWSKTVTPNLVVIQILSIQVGEWKVGQTKIRGYANTHVNPDEA